MQSNLVVAILLAALASPAPAQPARPAAASHKRAPAPPARKLTDAELEKAIRTRFARSKIATNQFQVKVQGGVATIEGRTEVMQHKGTATRLARGAGATSVNNRVQVSQAAKERAAANLAKGRRRAQVKRGEPRSER